MAEDFRVTAELEQGSGEAVGKRLSEHELEDEAKRKLGAGIAVSSDGPHLFLYADTQEAARSAKGILASILAADGVTATITVDRWHHEAEEWEPVDAPMPQTAAEHRQEQALEEAQDAADTAASHYAEWEVRVDLPKHGDAVELAERLESEGIPVTRRWKFLLVGADTEDDANVLADRLRSEAPAGAKFTVEASGEMVGEVAPQRSKLFYFIPNM